MSKKDPHLSVEGALHEVSNALTVLLGWIAEARDPSASPEDVKHALRIVEERARGARNLARRAIGAKVPPSGDGELEAVLRTVAAIGRARREHPALYSGTETQWWLSGEVLAWARTTGQDHALVILNPSDGEQWLTNGLAFAGLPPGGTWQDVVTEELFTASGDQLSVQVGARSARVLVAW